MAKRQPKEQPQDLPGLEERAIRPLQEAAHTYAEIRDGDERMELSQSEHALKEKVLGLMKKYEKTHYSFNGVVIDIIPEAETVKVRIKKPKADADGEEEADGEDA